MSSAEGPPDSPRPKTRIQWTALLSFTRKSHYWVLVLAIFSATCSALVQPAVSIFIGKFSDAAAQFGGGLIDSIELRQRTKSAVHAFIVLGCCTLVTNAGLFATWTIFGEMQAKSVREELFKSLLEKDLEWFEMRESGTSSLLTRLHTQIRELQHGVSQPAAFILSGLIEGFVAFGVALYFNWKLALVVVAILPLCAGVLLLIARGYQAHIESQNICLTDASKTANTAIGKPSLIKCFCTATLETARYAEAIGKAAAHSLRQSRITAAQMGALGFLMFAMFLLGFYYGGKLIHDGDSTPGKVITTIWATFMSVHAFQNVIPHLTFLARGQAAAVALRQLVDTVHRGARSHRIIDGSSPETCEGDIKLDKVSFAYPSRPECPVLQNCTLHFPAGRTTFLIGTSGSGKSTLSSLLMRFYSPTAGMICVDGQDVEQLSTTWLRNNITCIQQGATLFNETVRRNIALGHRYPKNVTDEQILESVKLAALDHTLAELSSGMDTGVGANGLNLSGGQIQRIMIARARIRDTPVLILDESTRALDHATTATVVDGIRKWREGLTTIIITHDLTQIRDDDFVYMLENGRVTVEGPRREMPDLSEHRIAVSETGPDSGARDGQSSRDENVRKNQRVRRRPHNLRWRKEGSTLHASFEQQLEDLDTGNYMQSPRALTGASRMTTLFGSSATSRHQSALNHRQTQAYVSPGPPDSIPPLPKTATVKPPKSATVELRPMSLHPSMAARAIQQKHAGDEPMPSPRLLNKPTVQFRAKFGGPSFQKVVEDVPMQMSLQGIYTTMWTNLDFVHRVKLTLGITAVCFRATLPSVFAFVMAKNFETFYQQTGWESKALKWTMVQLVIAVVDGVTAFYSQLLLEIAARRWADRLRVEAFKRVLQQPMAWFEQDQKASSNIASVLDRDPEELRTLLTRFASLGINIVIMMTVAMIWSMVACWKLTLVGLGSTPVIYSLSKAFDWVSVLWSARINSAADAVGLVFVETFTDIQTVRSYTLEAYFHRKYNRAIHRAYLTGVSRALYTATLFGLSESTVNFAMALVLWYAVKLLANYDFAVMPVLTSICLLILSSAQANVVFTIIPQIASAADSAMRLIHLARLPGNDEHTYTAQTRIMGDDTSVKTAVQFNDVVFAYSSRPLIPVLKGVSFSVSRGQCVAIVGGSGSGKTTIGLLLLGLYQAVTHSMDIDPPLAIFEQDLRSLHLQDVRGIIAVVPQNPFFIPGTVWDNICYGLEPRTRLTTQQNVNWAATQAAIHDFILSLPDQYDTIVGEGGLGLSGGQAQRVAIARALVRRPKILILDEATSALDGESAEMIRASLKAAAKGDVGVGKFVKGEASEMTVLAITHATEMMKWADKVVVLEEGRVQEEGAYEDLMSRKHGLWRMLNSSS